MSPQLSINDSQITATSSLFWNIQSLGNAFDWNGFSDVESEDLDEAASDDEEEVIDFDESSRDMKVELGRVYHVGASFKVMEDICEKAQSLDKRFNWHCLTLPLQELSLLNMTGSSLQQFLLLDVGCVVSLMSGI